MRSIKEYSVARLLIAGFGMGLVIGALRIAAQAAFSPSGWMPLVNGIIVGVVIAGTLAYFSTGGRDQQLLPRARKDDKSV